MKTTTKISLKYKYFSLGLHSCFNFANYLHSHSLLTSVRYSSTDCTTNPFNKEIPYTYITGTNKPIMLHLNIYVLDSIDEFSKIINTQIANNQIYTVYIKIRYNKDSFFMVGNQFGIDFKNNNDIALMLSIINNRLEYYYAEYNITNDDVVYIQISFRPLDVQVYAEYAADKPIHVSYKEHNHLVKKLNIPVSTNESSIGKPLPVTISNNLITHIWLCMNNKMVDFLQIIKNKAKFLRAKHSDNISSFDSGYKFYLLKDDSYYVLAVKSLDTGYIDKIRYSLDGVVINQVTDSLDNNLIIRKYGSKTVILDNENVILSKTNIKLKAIEKPSIKLDYISNPNIGVIDSETFSSNDSVHKIYAIGFRTNLNDDVNIFYIDKIEMNADNVVLNMVNELLRDKYNDITFYCHNLGGFDIVFILKVLYDYNDHHEDKYKISCILRHDKIIKVKITKNKHSFTILDSYCMLTESLYNLGKNFEVKTLKTSFPYKFSTQANLFYIGVTPSINFYEDMDSLQYANLYSNVWSFKDESIKYLKNDLNSLYEVIVKANKQVFRDFNVNIMDNVTISGLAVKIYLKDYYKNNIPVINKPSIYRDIKEGYYGGITEVYKPYGENLYYYDVNSLYPYVGLQDMPGCECSKINYYTDAQNIDDLFGFFYCSIETPNNSYLGLLPIRNDSGIQFPLGKWEGWYFSEELKFAKHNGYIIKVLKGYTFSREENVFKDYINKIYGIKSNPINKTQKSMAKSLLNNLLGRFGINLERGVTEVFTVKTFDLKALFCRITSYKFLSEDKVLVTYIPKIDTDIVASHGLDIIKVVNKQPDRELQPLNVTSIVISAAITAYARIHISQIKLDILNKGGNIYYSDTDSIVTDTELPEDMISGTELGKLKLEHKLSTGIFISGKIYAMINDKAEYINKAKGVKSNSLTYNDYLALLDCKDVQTALKTESNIDWDLGHVVICNKEVTVRNNSYTKRSKVLDSSNKWKDTVPVRINGIDKSLVVYSREKYLVIYKPIVDIDKLKSGTTSDLRFTLKSSTTSDLRYTLFLYLFITFMVPISYTAYVLTPLLLDDDNNDVNFMETSNDTNTLNIEANDNKDYKSIDTNSITQTSALDDYRYETDIEDNSSDNTEVLSNNTVEELTPTLKEEIRMFHIIQDNLENHYNNSLITLNPSSEVYNISKDILGDILDRLNKDIEALNNEGSLQSPVALNSEGSLYSPGEFSTESQKEYERLILQIREGSIISVFTPISEYTEDRPTSGQLAAYNTVNSDGLSDVSKHEGYSSEKNNNRPVPRPIVMITKRVEEGECIPPLPSWINVDYDHVDYRVKQWVLNTRFNRDYVNTHVDNTKPSDKNQAWLESEDYNIDSLFGENPKEFNNTTNDSTEVDTRPTPSVKSNKDSNTDWMESNSYDLDKLFNEKKE